MQGEEVTSWGAPAAEISFRKDRAPPSRRRVVGMKVEIEEWHAVSTWTWTSNAEDDACGICRLPFDGCCPDCKMPGDDCPIVWGECRSVEVF